MIYFTGFDATLEQCRAFAGLFGLCAPPRAIEYPPGGFAQGFHAEDGFHPWRPDVIWFLSLAEGSNGGTPTRVVDGTDVFAGMSDEWRQFALTHELRFHRSWTARELAARIPSSDEPEISGFLRTLSPRFSHRFDALGTLHTVYDAPITVRTPSGMESFSNSLLNAVLDPEYYGLTLSDGTAVPRAFVEHVGGLAAEREGALSWRPGDVALIDNYRMMHRRGEYSGTGRDLRVIYGEEFFGVTERPKTPTPVAEALKSMLLGDYVAPSLS